jgi:hypothetical protein
MFNVCAVRGLFPPTEVSTPHADRDGMRELGLFICILMFETKEKKIQKVEAPS